MIHLGIDLGTSNTLAAYVKDGKPVIYEFEDGAMIPSIIYIEEPSGLEHVGAVALDKWADPEYDIKKSFRRWKLDLGEKEMIRHLNIGGVQVPITPENLTTKMVEYVASQIGQGIGGEKIRSVLVTVPHGWRREKPEKCQLTRKAAAEAVCEGIRINVQETTVSEPVAAAAYWIWAMRNDGNKEVPDLDGKTILVCDIGGGTFDLSLIAVGSPGKPLDVIQAAHNNYAGDYVDALIVAEVCRAFNGKYGSAYPESAEEVLTLLDSESHPWIRPWFVQAKEDWKETISMRIASTADLNSIVPVKGNFDDGEQILRHKMTVDDFTQCFTPFYEHGRTLLRNLLSKLSNDHLPSAVVFSGGGSNIPGIRERIVEPVLTEILGSPEKAATCLQCISVNPNLIDCSIALGAALIANGLVEVREKLLSDVGIIGSLHDVIAKRLNVPEETDVLISPILKQGSSLPVRVESHSLGIRYTVKTGAVLKVQVVVDDDVDDPFIQDWELMIPANKAADSKERTLEWVMAADTDGVLTLTLKPAQGEESTFAGRFERKASRRSRIVFGAVTQEENSHFYRVSPAQIKKAVEETNLVPKAKKGRKS